ncbi:beta-glucosidase [Paenarthrobacter sp. 22069]|uniref:beta-glucosidase n=1 Tax=Paenarthrobacter sp. 22069 TaxID=3453864 RepID=UPI003F86D953
MHRLVSELTLEEKAGLVSGGSFWTTRAVERLDIPSVTMTDGPHGVRMQRASADHLGINESEPATSFPTAAATGSTWNPELLEEMGRALGTESRALGVDILLGPGVNIKRSPLCGRNFEYFSEDPLLSGALGAAWVNGIQSVGVGASLKHFAANNQETDRMRISAEVDERTLREIYLPAFENTVRSAQPATIMCSYNRLNGVFLSQNSRVLEEILRGDWGYDGYVVSDWGAVVDPVASVSSGLDLEMPSTGDRSPQRIVEAVRSGKLDESALDKAVSRVLTVHDRLLTDRADAGAVDFAAHHDLARRIAAESTVLLANDGDLLPLDPARGGPIAVIGEFAHTPRYQGAGSSHINPVQLDDALTAIIDATDRQVAFAPGFTLDGTTNQLLHEEAVALAATSSVVLLFLGLPAAEESEGFDRTHLGLPEAQLALLKAIAAVNSKVAVVLSNGGVVTLDGVSGVAPAILETWLGGQASGSAAADIIFGASEPGGRLAETIPHSLAHTPAHVNWPGNDGVVRYGEGVFVGYRWYDATDRAVAFPFGFGLSYTSFEYSNLSVSVPDAATARAIVEFTITNTGARPGSDVAQVYVSDLESSVQRPLRELKGFEKVHLAPGERRTVRIELDARAFAFWGRAGWTVEPGTFRIEAGFNSQDLPLSTDITLEVPAPPVPLDKNSTLEEWLSRPISAGVLQAAMSEMGQGAGLVADEETARLFGSMPLPTLLNFAQKAGQTNFDIDEKVTALLETVDVETERADQVNKYAVPTS